MSVFSNPASRSAEQAAAYTTAVLNLLGEQDPLAVLRRTPAALEEFRAGLAGDAIARPEAPGKWSIGHVLQHLADSDLVWGYRLRMVLAHDRPALTGYDQDRWAERLRYELSNPDETLQEFAVLRRMNLRLLQRASADDLTRVGVHQERGDESVERMMRLYAGHDLLHLRQLARIRDVITTHGR